MRLSSYEQKAIKKAFQEVFTNGKIYLFGSRIDDSKSGGDIDLYIVTDNQNLREKKAQLLSKLYEYIGEQKIDIIISKDQKRLIEQEALKNGVEL